MIQHSSLVQKIQKIIGYVYLADYYSFSDNDEKRIDALEKAKKIALKTKNDRDMAYVNFGLAQYYLKLDMNELLLMLLIRV